MKIVADESVDTQIVDKLRTQGHDVMYVAELAPGIDDETVLLRSRESNALLLTADKDFGDLVIPATTAPLGNLIDKARWSDSRTEGQHSRGSIRVAWRSHA